MKTDTIFYRIMQTAPGILSTSYGSLGDHLTSHQMSCAIAGVFPRWEITAIARMETNGSSP